MRGNRLGLLILGAALAACGATGAPPTAPSPAASQASAQPTVPAPATPAPTATPEPTPVPTSTPAPTAPPPPPVAPAGVKLDCTYESLPAEKGVTSCWTVWGKQPDPFTLRWTDKSASETGFNIYGRVKGGLVNCTTGGSPVPMTEWKLIATVGAGSHSWLGPGMDALYAQLVTIPPDTFFFPEDLQLAVTAFNDGGQSKRAGPVRFYEEGHGVCGD